MITLSALQTKEVVLLQSGKKLGFIIDFDIDDETGIIQALVVSTKQMSGSLFNRSTETLIPWKQIETIGDDIILVNDTADLTNRQNRPKEQE